MKTQKHTRSAFTLIELLAVIAIVAVLSALALVGIRRAAKQAQRTASASNLRQIYIAGEMYSLEFKGVLLPYESARFGPSRYWSLDHQYMFEFLPEQYKSGYGVWRRPGDDMSIPATGGKRENATNPAVGWSYARNLSLPRKRNFVQTSATNTRADNTVEKSKLPSPAQTMLLLETQRNGGLEYTQHDHVYFDDEGGAGKCLVAYLDGRVAKLSRRELLGDSPGTTSGWTDAQRTLWFGFPNVGARQTL